MVYKVTPDENQYYDEEFNFDGTEWMEMLDDSEQHMERFSPMLMSRHQSRRRQRALSPRKKLRNRTGTVREKIAQGGLMRISNDPIPVAPGLMRTVPSVSYAGKNYHAGPT